jgi:hypothetical protein
MIAHELRSKIEEMVVDPRMLIGLAGVSAVMALSGTASAYDSRGHKNACRSSIVGTYLTTVES